MVKKTEVKKQKSAKADDPPFVPDPKPATKKEVVTKAKSATPQSKAPMVTPVATKVAKPVAAKPTAKKAAPSVVKEPVKRLPEPKPAKATSKQDKAAAAKKLKQPDTIKTQTTNKASIHSMQEAIAEQFRK